VKQQRNIPSKPTSSCSLFILSELREVIFVANEVKNEQKSKERQGFLKKEKHIPRGHTSP
jgi:hypothetical protein